MNFYPLLKKTLPAIMMLSAFVGCETLGDSTRKSRSPLPIEVVNRGGGSLGTTRAYETESRLYIVGSFKRSTGRHLPVTAHVDIQLLDKGGGILASQDEEIDASHPRIAQARGNRIFYTAGFPVEAARQAAKIRILFHQELHP